MSLYFKVYLKWLLRCRIDEFKVLEGQNSVAQQLLAYLAFLLSQNCGGPVEVNPVGGPKFCGSWKFWGNLESWKTPCSTWESVPNLKGTFKNYVTRLGGREVGKKPG